MPAARSPCVAIVDDDASFRDALGGLLAAMGMEVLAFPSAEAFMAAGPHEAVFCLLLDMQMPGMDGLALLAALQTQPWRMPVVFITSRLDPAFRERAMAAGALECLAKPFQPADLLRLLSAARAIRGGGEPEAYTKV
ncbi:response regulator transcription factor [Caulobacter sp. KR2-114]|uniref:response regulator transcription factor n=1 Tax=Caulobacter sp. KR2-114 TaxID=3400912 RepID=UPI003C10CFC5